MNIVRVEGLAKRYNEDWAVDHISFEIAQGEIYGLLGPNGAGKSTTISMLSCLFPPTEGDAYLNGSSICRDPMGVRRSIGVVPQEISLYPTLTARENLAFWGRMYDVPKAEVNDRINTVLQTVGLAERSNERVDTYSGGMKRRINIAVGLLHRPQILLLDEPTVGVDPQSRNKILETVKELNSQGMTVIYTSHYMEEVEYLCDRVAILDEGKIIAAGTIPELKGLVNNETVIKINLVLHIGADQMDLTESVRKVAGISSAVERNHSIEIRSTEGTKPLAAVISVLNELGTGVAGVEVREPNLETVFLHLTGKELRDK